MDERLWEAAEGGDEWGRIVRQRQTEVVEVGRQQRREVVPALLSRQRHHARRVGVAASRGGEMML